ncbi:MAG: hypothetical protein WD995_03470 [Gemmatimonadota bacterium]
MTPNDTSSPEERDRLIAEALAHAEARDLSYRPPSEGPTRQWKGLVASILLMAGAALLVAPPTWLRGEPVPDVPASAKALGARMMLVLQAQEIEAYRQRYQRLPDSLDELGVVMPGVRFVRSNDRVYQLVAYGPDGRAVVYESTRPAPELTEQASDFMEGIDRS